MESLNMWGEWGRCAHTVRCWAHSPAVVDKPGGMKELHHLSRWIIASGGTEEEEDRTQQEKHGVWEVAWVGRKAHQLLRVLFGFQIPLQCLFLSHCNRKGGRMGVGEREIKTEDAMRKSTCQKDGRLLWQLLIQCAVSHVSLQFSKEEVNEYGGGQSWRGGHFFHLSAEVECKCDCQAWR